MRLLETGSYEFHVSYDYVPPYAILSHTWEDEEISFQDWQLLFAQQSGCQCGVLEQRNSLRSKSGYGKILKFCDQSKEDGYTYAWIDTCCIDKSSSTELSEAINSMYEWYARSDVCYAYLSDVQPMASISETLPRLSDNMLSHLKDSRWFTRGWTLQELMAPRRVIFLAADWTCLGYTRQLDNAPFLLHLPRYEEAPSLAQQLSRITGIADYYIERQPGCRPPSIAQRMSWASHRRTTRPEDIAYCLLGIFNVHMPLMYGEGTRAFLRLQTEIIKVSDDDSIFAWDSHAMTYTSNYYRSGFFASSPSAYANAGSIVRCEGRVGSHNKNFHAMTNRGLEIGLDVGFLPNSEETMTPVGVLNCRYEDDYRGPLALRVSRAWERNELDTILLDAQRKRIVKRVLGVSRDHSSQSPFTFTRDLSKGTLYTKPQYTILCAPQPGVTPSREDFMPFSIWVPDLRDTVKIFFEVELALHTIAGYPAEKWHPEEKVFLRPFGSYQRAFVAVLFSHHTGPSSPEQRFVVLTYGSFRRGVCKIIPAPDRAKFIANMQMQEQQYRSECEAIYQLSHLPLYDEASGSSDDLYDTDERHGLIKTSPDPGSVFALSNGLLAYCTVNIFGDTVLVVRVKVISGSQSLIAEVSEDRWNFDTERMQM